MTTPTITAGIPLIPLWVKVCYTLFVSTLVPVYWWYYGPANFLWGSDVALLLGLFGFWLESSLLVSMMAVMVVIADSLWVLDFVIRLIFGPESLGFIAGTDYMFIADTPLFVRLFALFHTVMPPLLLWGIYRLGYHRDYQHVDHVDLHLHASNVSARPTCSHDQGNLKKKIMHSMIICSINNC